MLLNTGQMLQNRYRIVEQLGQGGMGTVYRAHDNRLDISVAIKELLPQPGLDPEMLARLREQFLQEAKVLARLNHTHLVNVSDYFEQSGKAYLVMKYVEGESLAERIEREGALPEAEVVAWTEQILDALAYCHAQHILHRDIKPQNIVIQPNGDAVLVDFGLVKLWDPHDPHTQTVIRGTGTPAYAPPEQYDLVAGHTDARSDIYSLGATVYHALTGKMPPTATQRMVDPQALRPLRVLKPEVSPRLEHVVHHALEPQPERRFQNVQEMAAALQGADRPGPVSRPQRKAGWLWWGIGAVALIALVMFVGVGAWPRPDETQTPTMTEVGQHPTLTATKTVAPTHTPTAEQQPTPSLEPTATRSPTSTPRPVLTYESSALQAVANTSWDHFQSPPLGDVTLGEIPFNLSAQIFKSQAEPAPNNAYPTQATLSLHVAQAQRIYLLITAGNAFARYNRLSIGEVRVMCEGHEHLLTTLELGRNLREWHTIGEVVTTAPEAELVWRGSLADFPNLMGHIDMLTLTLPEACRQGVLSEVRIEDLSTETVESRDPALNVIGLTVAYYP